MREIPLRARDGSVRAYAVVDDEDYDWLTQHRWKLTRKGYAQREARIDGRWRAIPMHRAILELRHGDPRQGDHINGVRLDNRRSNLRVCEPQEQAQNVRRRSALPRGVSRHRGGRFQATVKLSGVGHYLGLHDTPEQAATVAAAFRAEHMPLAVS